MGTLGWVRSVSRLVAGIPLVTLAAAAPMAARADQADPRLLYATWRWVRTADDSATSSIALTPAACRCDGLLILKEGGEYEFAVEDSVSQTRLWQGIFTVHRPPDGAAGMVEGSPADFLVSFTGWWVDSERDQLARFVGSDSLLTVSARPGLSGQPIRRWYVRATMQLPGEGEGLPGFVAPNPVKVVQPVYPDSIIQRGLHGEIKLQVMVGVDGLVKHIKVIAAPPGMSEPVIEAVKQWVFTPARIRGKPVAVWIEMPIRFEE